MNIRCQDAFSDRVSQETNVKALILLLSTMLVSFSVANAEVYKWVDENGNMHFSDSPPPKQKTEEVRIQGASAPSPQRTASAAVRQPDAGDGVAAGPSDREVCSKAIRNISRYAPAWERKIKAKMPDMAPDERARAEQSLVELRDNVKKVKTGMNQCIAEMSDSAHRGKTECMANAENDTAAMFCVM